MPLTQPEVFVPSNGNYVGRAKTVDGCEGTDLSATTGLFHLLGGRYGCDFVATTWNGGSVVVEKLALDGTTWVPALDPWTANDAVLAEMPEGDYRLALAGGPTGVYVNIKRI